MNTIIGVQFIIVVVAVAGLIDDHRSLDPYVREGEMKNGVRLSSIIT